MMGFFKEWFKKGIVAIKDLLNENGDMLTFQEFCDTYACKIKN